MILSSNFKFVKYLQTKTVNTQSLILYKYGLDKTDIIQKRQVGIYQ